MIICRPQIKPKNRHLQSFLASARLRLWRLRGANPVVDQEQEQRIETPLATLQGYASKHPDSKTLAILIHGWEGSAHSTYIQLLANRLYAEGLSVFRLNLRDHGTSHSFNKDLFHSCRIEEVVAAIQSIQNQWADHEFVLAGFSLGGNFAVRTAAHAADAGLSFKHVFAVSPPVQPKNSMLSIQENSLYDRYFLRKWKRSLSLKHNLFPDLFNSQEWRDEKDLNRLTELLILDHTPFQSTDDYFSGYALTPELITQIKHPTHIITAWDDPVIPFADFSTIDRLPQIKILTSPHGGHCGFIQGWHMRSWIEDHIINEIKNAT